MLALKQALSLPSLQKLGDAYVPPSIDQLEAWYKNKVGVIWTGNEVSAWLDSSNNSHDMEQSTGGEQPNYNGGRITFESHVLPQISTNLQTASQISLPGDFTLGLKIKTLSSNGAFLSDNTTSNEYFKFSGLDSDRISFRINDSTSQNLDLDSGTFGDDYIVITRASNVFTLWQNGVEQTALNPTLAGTCLIDVIGLRKNDQNGFDGFIQEIMIYTISNASLTAQINLRLASL